VAWVVLQPSVIRSYETTENRLANSSSNDVDMKMMLPALCNHRRTFYDKILMH
jgi:hypothetical protein